MCLKKPMKISTRKTNCMNVIGRSLVFIFSFCFGCWCNSIDKQQSTISMKFPHFQCTMLVYTQAARAHAHTHTNKKWIVLIPSYYLFDCNCIMVRRKWKTNTTKKGEKKLLQVFLYKSENKYLFYISMYACACLLLLQYIELYAIHLL